MSGSRSARLALEPPLRDLLSAVRNALTGDVYVVGGFLRDLLLRRQPRDLDLAVAGDPRPAAEAVAAALGGHAFPLDDQRGQLRVVLPEGQALRYVDVASLRGDIQSDLASRDYTIDAMAALLEPDGSLGSLLDPFGGEKDARSRKVRLVSEQALRDDPLRLLRGVRLATELELAVAPDTAAAIKAHAALVQQSAAERQRDEVCRILATQRAAGGLRLLDELGLLEQVFPEVTAARGVTQPKEHYWNVFDHLVETVAVLDCLLADSPPKDGRAKQIARAFHDGLRWYPVREYFAAATGGQDRAGLLKLAGLLHDVGKPETRGPDETGRIRFFGHAELGARMAEAACRRLRFGNRETRFVAQLVDEHLRPTQLSAIGVEPTNRAIYRFFRDLGDAAPACLVLSLADAAAALGPRLQMDRWRGHVAYVSYILARKEALRTAPDQKRIVSGNEIMAALGIGPGPLVGRLLAAVDEAAGSGELNSREDALQYARDLAEAWEREPARAATGGK